MYDEAWEDIRDTVGLTYSIDSTELGAMPADQDEDVLKHYGSTENNH